MSAELLRRAAEQMRSDAAACGDRPTDFIPAVADWLTATASICDIEEMCGLPTPRPDGLPNVDGIASALTAARAYLGESQ